MGPPIGGEASEHEALQPKPQPHPAELYIMHQDNLHEEQKMDTVVPEGSCMPFILTLAEVFWHP